MRLNQFQGAYNASETFMPQIAGGNVNDVLVAETYTAMHRRWAEYAPVVVRDFNMYCYYRHCKQPSVWANVNGVANLRCKGKPDYDNEIGCDSLDMRVNVMNVPPYD